MIPDSRKVKKKKMVRLKNPRLVRSLTAGGAMAAVTIIYQRTRFQPSDFAQLWFASRAWLHGIDPYSVVGPGRSFDWPFPLFYPMTAVLAAVPLTGFPLAIADPIVVGLGAALFAWVVMRERLDDPRLLMFVSGAGALAVQTSQWSPMLCAAALMPTLGFLLACKPTLGLALLSAYPSRRAVIGIVLFGLVSLIAWPSWPREWLAALPAGTHLVAPILRPGGFLILLALFRWRLPEARLLVAWACMPQTPQFYEAVPLFLIPRTWPEGLTLTGLLYVAGFGYRLGGPYVNYDAYMNAGGMWMLWFLFIPCTVFVLRRASRPVLIHDRLSTETV
jgi:hypothetical protein